MNVVLLLSGVQGCGKTTVAERLSTVHGFVIADVGSLMFEKLALEFNLSSRDQLRALPPSVVVRTADLVLAQFVQKETSQPKVLVTHFAPRLLAGVYFPHNHSGPYASGIRGIAMLVSAPREILERRQQDRSRARAPADMGLLAVEQWRYLVVALNSAFNLRVPLWVVPNPDGQVDRAADAIYLLAQQLMPSKAAGQDRLRRQQHDTTGR